MDLFLAILALTFSALGLLWLLVPIFAGIAFVPSSEARIQRALEMCALQPGELIYDLGCGDGRVLIAAAKRYDIRAVGIEISPLHCLYAWLRVQAAGVGKQVSIRWGNIYHSRFTDADVIYQYGHSHFAARLGAQLQEQLRPGARFVSINVDVPGWKPVAFDRHLTIFLYRMPPEPGSLADLLMDQAAG